MSSNSSYCRFFFVSLLLLCFINTPLLAQNPSTETMLKLKSRAEVFTQKILTANISSIEGQMSDTMRKTITADTARTIAGDVMRKGGQLEEIGSAAMLVQDDGRIVAMVPLLMTKENFHSQVVFERAGERAKVVGFAVVPYQPGLHKSDPASNSKFAKPLPSPDYAVSNLFRDKTLPATPYGEHFDVQFTVPTVAMESAKVPVVIFLQGVGSFDGDYTIGRSKIYRDLAEGLATKGIATARFASASGRNADLLQGLPYNLDDLYFQDVRAVVDVIKSQPELNAEEIYILGHNLGGMVAPALAKELKLRGVVLLAPLPPNPDQYLEIQTAKLLPTMRPDSADYAMLQAAAELAKSGDLSSMNDTELVLNYPGSLWKHWADLNSQQSLETEGFKAMLVLAENDKVLEGGLDSAWKPAFSSPRAGRLVKTYQQTTHLFVPSSDNPTETLGEGHVQKSVVTDIASFIKVGRLPQP